MADEKLNQEQSELRLQAMYAQLQAHKQIINEQLEALVVLKTNLIIMTQAHTDCCKQNEELIKANANYLAEKNALSVQE